MHNIALKVNNNAYEHLIYFLSNLKDDVEVIKDELVSKKMIDDEFKINEDYCQEMADKIKLGNINDFKPIDDVDVHIKELMNAIS